MSLKSIEKNSDTFTNNHLRNMAFYMKYRMVDTNFYMNFHTHQGYELYFFHKGEGNYLIGDRIFPLEGNDVILVGALESHKSAPNVQKPFMRTVINFLPDMLDMQERKMFLKLFNDADNPRRQHLRLSEEKQSQLDYWLEQLNIEYFTRPFGYELAIRIHLRELLLIIYRMVFTDSYDEKKPVSSQTVHPKIEEVIKYLSNHSTEDISLEDLSSKFFINSYYLCHLFKKTAGVTLLEFQLQRRIHNAKLDLIYTDSPIAVIAAKVGFKSSSYFGVVFKKFEEISPKQYRKKFQEYHNIAESSLPTK